MAKCGPDTQVLGAVVLSILGSSRNDELKTYFERYDIKECEPDKFYPVKSFIGMIDEIVRDRQGLDSMYDFVSMGISNGLSVPLPPEVDTLEKWLTIFSGRYQTLYKGSDIGYVYCDKLAEGHYQLRICWPWVDDIAYGMIYGMCQRFLPAGSNYIVYYDDSVPQADKGGNETVIHVEFKA